MTADYRSQALDDPSAIIQELYLSDPSANFPHNVAEHFSKLFESAAAFKKIPPLNIQHPPGYHRDRALVRFRAMIQDTSLSAEMYISQHADGTCGGWGLYETDGASGSSARDVDYSSLRECNVLWATSVPAESAWCANELDDRAIESITAPNSSRTYQRAHKFPFPGLDHIGIQVKVYDRVGDEAFKSTDIVTFVGILSAEPCNLDNSLEAHHDVPTLHVIFTRTDETNILTRPFPRIVRELPDENTLRVIDERANLVAQDTAQLRDDLIAWIAEEALDGDRQVAEWILLSCIARVQSRHPPLLPPPLLISHFPTPPPTQSTLGPDTVPVPTLSAVLSLLLPLTHTLGLSLENLNKAAYSPESKDEDLHAGVLQLPQGTVLLVSEGGVREGQVSERGVLNIRALQEVMDTQTLAYVFPFSRFSFLTDISCVVLAEGRKTLYKPAEQIKIPPKEKLEAFRDLVVGARCGKVVVPEGTSEHIQAEFVRQRQGDRSVTADDLIRWMTIARSYALSLHETTLSVETWQRAKALDEQRKLLLA